MALDGYIIHLDLTPVKEMIFLLRNATNNLNQLAKKANQNSCIFEAEIQKIQADYDVIWDSTKQILRNLSRL